MEFHPASTMHALNLMQNPSSACSLPMRGEPLTRLSNLLLDRQTRSQLWPQVFDAVEDYVEHVDLLRVSPGLDVARARSELKAFDFQQPLEPSEAIRFVVESLRTNQVQVSHPRYFGSDCA